jgi:hypothetical protein
MMDLPISVLLRLIAIILSLLLSYQVNGPSLHREELQEPQDPLDLDQVQEQPQVQDPQVQRVLQEVAQEPQVPQALQEVVQEPQDLQALQEVVQDQQDPQVLQDLS